MKKRYKIAWWIISIGWFPMMFVTASSVSWSRANGFWLLMATFLICVVGVLILTTTPIEDILRKSEELDKEKEKFIKTNLDYDRWIEAVKREAVYKAGLKFEDIKEQYNKLVKGNWK